MPELTIPQVLYVQEALLQILRRNGSLLFEKIRNHLWIHTDGDAELPREGE